MAKQLPKRLILSFEEIKRIGILTEFCKSENFTEEWMIKRCTDDMIFSFYTEILPKGYVYEVPKGYTIQGFNK